MDLDDLIQGISALLKDVVVQPLVQFIVGLNKGNMAVLSVLIAAAVALGLLLWPPQSFLRSPWL